MKINYKKELRKLITKKISEKNELLKQIKTLNDSIDDDPDIKEAIVLKIKNMQAQAEILNGRIYIAIDNLKLIEQAEEKYERFCRERYNSAVYYLKTN